MSELMRKSTRASISDGADAGIFAPSNESTKITVTIPRKKKDKVSRAFTQDDQKLIKDYALFCALKERGYLSYTKRRKVPKKLTIVTEEEFRNLLVEATKERQQVAALPANMRCLELVLERKNIATSR